MTPTPTDAQERRHVRLPDGTIGTLMYVPPPPGERVGPVRNKANTARWALVNVAGRHRRLPPSMLVVIPGEVS